MSKKHGVMARRAGGDLAGGAVNREERRRVRGALRGVYSRLIALKSRQPITGGGIMSALEEVGVRVDTTTAGLLEQHVATGVPPGIHPGRHVGSVQLPTMVRQDAGSVMRDKAFVNAYEGLRQRVSVEKGQISLGLIELGREGRVVGPREVADVLMASGVSGDVRLIEAVALVAADEAGGVIDAPTVHRSTPKLKR